MSRRLSLLFLVFASADFAQTPALHYEVVSIHESKPDPYVDNTRYRGHLHDSLVDIIDFSDLNLFMQAFGVGIYEMDLPKDLSEATYNMHFSSGPEVNAALRGMTDEQAKQAHQRMLQEVLTERFHLRYHFADREMAVYAVTVGTPGKLHASAVHPYADSEFSAELGEGDPAKPWTRMDCTAQHCAWHVRGVSLDFLVRDLSLDVRAPTVNRTGLKGLWDFDLRWKLESNAAASMEDDQYPPLGTALTQQLGLRLERAKAPVRVLVVDHIEAPTPN